MKHSIYKPDPLEPDYLNGQVYVQVGGKNILKVANDVNEIKSFIEV